MGAGPFGRGLGHGLQKFGYLPEDQNDFLFAVSLEGLRGHQHLAVHQEVVATAAFSGCEQAIVIVIKCLRRASIS